jgi:hypothetical protein
MKDSIMEFHYCKHDINSLGALLHDYVSVPLLVEYIKHNDISREIVKVFGKTIMENLSPMDIIQDACIQVGEKINKDFVCYIAVSSPRLYADFIDFLISLNDEKVIDILKKTLRCAGLYNKVPITIDLKKIPNEYHNWLFEELEIYYDISDVTKEQLQKEENPYTYLNLHGSNLTATLEPKYDFVYENITDLIWYFR